MSGKMNVSIESVGSVAIVSLNLPEKRNAFAPEMIGQLKEAFRVITADERIKVALLRGVGKSFSAGADLAWMKSMANYTHAENMTDSQELFEMFWSLYSCSKPVLALAHGHVFGGALGLLAACDMVACEEDTKLCFSEVKLGLAPAVISPFVMSKMSRKWANELMLTGRVFTAKEAKNAGLANMTGSLHECENYCEGQINEILRSGKQAVSATKELMRTVSGLNKTALMSMTCQVIADRRVSDEGQEGLAAFFSKEDPSWRTNEEFRWDKFKR